MSENEQQLTRDFIGAFNNGEFHKYQDSYDVKDRGTGLYLNAIVDWFLLWHNKNK